MDCRLYIVSSHPLAGSFLVRSIAMLPDLRRQLAPKPYTHPGLVPQDTNQCLFLLDLSSLGQDVRSLCRVLRLRCPASRFLVLLPEQTSEEEMLRLMYAGIEGFVRMGDAVEEETCQAIRSMLNGNLWVPAHILRR